MYTPQPSNLIYTLLSQKINYEVTCAGYSSQHNWQKKKIKYSPNCVPTYYGAAKHDEEVVWSAHPDIK